jgi:hypothetical protein
MWSWLCGSGWELLWFVPPLALILLPSRWDPAIRLKEYFERERLDAKDGANRRNPDQTRR